MLLKTLYFVAAITLHFSCSIQALDAANSSPTNVSIFPSTVGGLMINSTDGKTDATTSSSDMIEESGINKVEQIMDDILRNVEKSIHDLTNQELTDVPKVTETQQIEQSKPMQEGKKGVETLEDPVDLELSVLHDEIINEKNNPDAAMVNERAKIKMVEQSYEVEYKNESEPSYSGIALAVVGTVVTILILVAVITATAYRLKNLSIHRTPETNQSHQSTSLA